MSLIEYIGSIGGVGGVLATVMFFAYKHLVNQARDDRKFMENRLTELIKDYNEACYSTRDALMQNVKVQSELYTWLKARNGH